MSYGAHYSAVVKSPASNRKREMVTSRVKYPRENINATIITWFTVEDVWLLAVLEKLIKKVKILFKPV